MELDVIEATTGFSIWQREAARASLTLTVVPSDATEGIRIGEGFAFSSRLWSKGGPQRISAQAVFRPRSDFDGFLDEANAEMPAGFVRALLPNEEGDRAELTFFLFASEDWIVDLSRKLEGKEPGAIRLQIDHGTFLGLETLINAPDSDDGPTHNAIIPISGYSIHLKQLTTSILEIRDYRRKAEDQRQLEDSDNIDDFKKWRSEMKANAENADPVIKAVKEIRFVLIAILLLLTASLFAF